MRHSSPILRVAFRAFGFCSRTGVARIYVSVFCGFFGRYHEKETLIVALEDRAFGFSCVRFELFGSRSWPGPCADEGSGVRGCFTPRGSAFHPSSRECPAGPPRCRLRSRRRWGVRELPDEAHTPRSALRAGAPRGARRWTIVSERLRTRLPEKRAPSRDRRTGSAWSFATLRLFRAAVRERGRVVRNGWRCVSAAPAEGLLVVMGGTSVEQKSRRVLPGAGWRFGAISGIPGRTR